MLTYCDLNFFVGCKLKDQCAPSASPSGIYYFHGSGAVHLFTPIYKPKQKWREIEREREIDFVNEILL